MSELFVILDQIIEFYNKKWLGISCVIFWGKTFDMRLSDIGSFQYLFGEKFWEFI
jgi:hypothetical protein